ncbi:MAG TPA: tellurium resistance protein TerC [Crocinitomicaceae bacterium]|nr:tellurium resistance protein TerC [Crocinitomicaceae bacterium]
MGDLFTLANLGTLLMLILLQAVLGFDNLLYISLESKRVEKSKQSYVRTLGIGIAIFLRIGLLFALYYLLQYFQEIFFSIDNSFFSMELNVHSLIIVFGGLFIMYTAIKEIWHMISFEEGEQTAEKKSSLGKVLFAIVFMNVIFSFDSILSAMALSDNLIIMSIAIVISGILMIVLADTVANFLQKNKMYEVLGLFVLFVVGIMLLLEGSHMAGVKIFGEEIHEMSKTTFYFIIFILVVIDIVQSKYQKKINATKKIEE